MQLSRAVRDDVGHTQCHCRGLPARFLTARYDRHDSQSPVESTHARQSRTPHGHTNDTRSAGSGRTRRDETRIINIESYFLVGFSYPLPACIQTQTPPTQLGTPRGTPAGRPSPRPSGTAPVVRSRRDWINKRNVITQQKKITSLPWCARKFCVVLVARSISCFTAITSSRPWRGRAEEVGQKSAAARFATSHAGAWACVTATHSR